MREERISHTQLMELTCVCVLSPAIRILPTVIAKNAGGGVIISAILGGAISILYIIYLYNSPTVELKSLSGKSSLLRRIFLVILTIWLLFYAGFVLRASGERLVSTVFENGHVTGIILPILAVSAWTASKKLPCIARAGACIFFIMMFSIICITLFGIKDVRIEYILPVTHESTEGILIGAWTMFDVMSVFFYTSLLYGKTSEGNSSKKRTIIFAMLIWLTASAIAILTLGTLSPEMAAITDHPFFVMTRNITVKGVIERIDSVVIAMWIMSDFVYLTTLIKTVVMSVGAISQKPERKNTTLFIALAVFIMSLSWGQDQFQFRFLSEEIIPIINTAVVTVGMMILKIDGEICKISTNEKSKPPNI